MNEHFVSAIIVAAGSGRRLGGVKKQFLDLKGVPVLVHSIQTLSAVNEVFEIVVVTGNDDIAFVEKLKKAYNLQKVTAVTAGGRTRQESVRAGFDKTSQKASFIAVHDAARPFLCKEDVRAVIQDAEKWQAAILAVPVKDTIKLTEDGFVKKTIDRDMLCAVQTPQVFARDLFLRALCKAEEEKLDFTDDSQLLEWMGINVKLTVGKDENIKITTRADWKRANADGGRKMRVGHGYDVHKFAEARPLILCGVHIPHERGLLGHSDADVALHALMDALLGAAALGDIGKHFPDNDEHYLNADSCMLLKNVVHMLAKNGFAASNVDLTIIAQAPKIAPYIPMMRERLADILHLSSDHVNIKATTEEGLGFTGQKEGISAHAVCLLKEFENVDKF